ncbi:MAG: low molecular weight protein-tyrosine-phosphatase [Saprospiraceae bacterium]
MKVLVVCLGNICRSPLAEGLLRSKVEALGLNWVIDSAGTGSYHEGHQPHEKSIEVARKHGMDISNQRARKIGKEDFSNFDLILAMDTANRDDMYEMTSTMEQRNKIRLVMDVLYPNRDVSVPDPYYGGIEGYEKVWDMLDQACDKIIEVYTALPTKH